MLAFFDYICGVTIKFDTYEQNLISGSHIYICDGCNGCNGCDVITLLSRLRNCVGSS